jgi:hypothetical protein
LYSDTINFTLFWFKFFIKKNISNIVWDIQLKLKILINSNKVHQIDKLDNSAYNIDRIMPLFNLEILVKVFVKTNISIIAWDIQLKLTILIYSNKVHQIDKLDNSAYNIDRIMPLWNLEILVKVFL